MLTVFDPARGAGGDERKHTAVLHTIQEFMCLFHNGQVGTEVGVEYFVKADAAKGCCHLALYIGADRITKFLAQSGAYCRSGLHDDMLLRICDGCQNLVHLGFLLESTGWADCDTLAAGDTGGLAQSHIKRGSDKGGKAAHVGADNANALYLLADCRTAAAEDTFAVVTDHVNGAVIDDGRGALTIVIVFIGNAELLTELLQLAVSAADAG